jgi:hypothetical protein
MVEGINNSPMFPNQPSKGVDWEEIAHLFSGAGGVEEIDADLQYQLQNHNAEAASKDLEKLGKLINQLDEFVGKHPQAPLKELRDDLSSLSDSYNKISALLKSNPPNFDQALLEEKNAQNLLGGIKHIIFIG